MKKRIFLILMPILLLPYIGFSLANRRTDASADYPIGEMTVSANGQTLTAVKSWSFSLQDGLAGDAIQLAARGLEAEIETIAYTTDFTVSFNEEPVSIHYTVYGEDFNTRVDDYWHMSALAIPVETGVYILCVQAVWGTEDNYAGYDYLCRVLVP